MAKNYAVRLRCPDGDKDTWLILEGRSETLEQILRTTWDFECPTHGVQRELPIEVTESVVGAAPEKGSSPAPGPHATLPPEPPGRRTKLRSSERQSLRLPIVVYGWLKNQGAFHEETSTIVVNISGALVSLNAQVGLGETLFLINKGTREEQEIRVVYVEPGLGGQTRVGVAFKGPLPDFWRKAPRKSRIARSLRVLVQGTDPHGHPFKQNAYTVDLSPTGARLDGLGFLTTPGQVIEVKRPWRGKARFRVVWIGQIGTEQANQVGICCLEPEKNLWGLLLPEPEVAMPTAIPKPLKK